MRSVHKKSWPLCTVHFRARVYDSGYWNSGGSRNRVNYFQTVSSKNKVGRCLMYKSGYSTFFLSKCGSRSCLLAQSSQKTCKYLTDRTLTTSEHKRRIPAVAAPVAGAYVVGIAAQLLAAYVFIVLAEFVAFASALSELFLLEFAQPLLNC